VLLGGAEVKVGDAGSVLRSGLAVFLRETGAGGEPCVMGRLRVNEPQERKGPHIQQAQQPGDGRGPSRSPNSFHGVIATRVAQRWASRTLSRS
jgi:hypothetical protein